MKTKILLFGALVAMAACNKTGGENPVPIDPQTPVEVKFTANIAPKSTRVANDQWENGDGILVLMNKMAGESFSTPAVVINNNVYVHNFTWAQYKIQSGILKKNSDDPLYYPGNNVDFVAFHGANCGFLPYKSEEGRPQMIGCTYLLSDQRFGLFSEMLYSNNAKNIAPSNNPVALNFKYLFPKLRLTVTATERSNLTAEHTGRMFVGITGGNMGVISMSFNLDTGMIGEIMERSDDDRVYMYRAGHTETSATFEAIVPPMTEAAELTYSFTIGGETYTATVTDKYEGGKLYNLPFKLDIVDGVPEVMYVAAEATIIPRDPVDRPEVIVQ